MLDDAILRLPAVKAAVGLSKTTIYQRIKDRTFPEPVPIDGDRVGWPESAIKAWIAAKKAGMPWQLPTEAESFTPQEVITHSLSLVDRAEVVKNRVKKQRKAKSDVAFRLTADSPAVPSKPPQKQLARRRRPSRKDAAPGAMQTEFSFD